MGSGSQGDHQTQKTKYQQEGYKQKRNSEQRRPAKLTLDKFFTPLQKISKTFTQQGKRDHINESTQRRRKPDKTDVPSSPAVVTPTTTKKPKSRHRTIQLEYGKNQPSRSTQYRQSLMPTREAMEQTASRIGKDKEVDDFFGHTLEQIDNLSVFRCFLQNPNGINPHPNNLDFKLGLQTCYDSCAAVVGLTETNVEWSHYKERENLFSSVKNFWDSTSLTTSTSSQLFSSRYKPGGTMLAICGSQWVSRVIEKGEDPTGLGNFTYQGLQGKKPNKVMIILYYRLCQQHLETAGEKTAWKQQYRILQKRFPKENIDPRRQSVLDLQNFIGKKQEEGYDIILLTDGNENLSKPGSWCPIPIQDKQHVFCREHDGSLLTLIKTCGLIDPLVQFHPTTQYPSTYSRGSQRIDGIFVSPRLMNSVIRVGMSPLYTFFVGDHRLLYVDFDSKRLFGEPTHQLVRPVGRGLQLKDPRKVEQYNANKVAQVEYHKIVEKLRKLVTISELGLFSGRHQQRYEKLDKLMVEISRSSERLVTRRYSVKYDWSPTLAQAVFAMRFWKLRKRQLLGSNIKQGTLIRHQQRAELPSDCLKVYPIETIKGKLQEAINNMYSLQQKHVELRQTYLEGLAEALVLKKYPTLRDEGETAFKSEQIGKKLRDLKNREDARRMYSKIGKVLNAATGSVSRLDVPDDTELYDPSGISYGDPRKPTTWKGLWKSITEPAELEKIIIATNIKQYNQAEQTPFGSGPLAELFGPDGTTPFVLNFLAGEPIPPEIFESLQPETQRILGVLQLPRSIQLPSIPDITPEQFSKRYRLQDEGKSSSVISGCHIGHFKAAAEHPTLAWVHATMMSLPYREGFSPKRWQDVVDVIIPKEEGNFKQHRMRIIRLCESDFNHSLAEKLVYPVGKFFEESNLYPSTQYGSRKGLLSVSAVLNKILSYDIVRLVKTVMTSVENDAIGCYDRIIQVIVALYLLSLGFPLEGIKTICRTFRLTRHFIQTAFGLSDATYESTQETPLFGAGQGTTGGPIFWLLSFCLMHEAMDDDMAKMKFISACATFLSERYGEVFVDDSNLGITSSVPYDPSLTLQENIEQRTMAIREETEKLAQHYERLLFATGGALNIKKCHWNLITWIWSNGVARMATKHESPAQINLSSGYNTETEEVPRLEPTEGYRTLGVYIAPTGSMSKSFTVHREISERFAGLLGPSSLNKQESYFAFTLYFFPKISYALPVTTYSQQECRKIQAPAMAVFLSKIGLNRHTARSIVNGPLERGGLELPDFYAEQGIGQLRLLLGHMLAGDKTSVLILIEMSYLQLLTGAKTSFFNLPYSKYARWIEKTWLTSIWQFLTNANLKLAIAKATRFEEQRENDLFLMTIFVYAKYSARDLRQLNRCRIYHQVLTLADIATADGQRIDPSYYLPTRNADRESVLKWPEQGQPSPQAWTLWRQALKFLLYKGRLKQPLGSWLRQPYQKWRWKLCASSFTLYHLHSEGHWTRYLPLPSGNTGTRADSRKRYFLDQGRQCDPPQEPLILATLVTAPEDGDLVTINWMSELANNGDPTQAQQTPTTSQSTQSTGSISDTSTDTDDTRGEVIADFVPRFTSLFQSIDDYFYRLLGPFELPTEEALQLLSEQITNHSLLACSDGSFKRSQRRGCHAWIFATTEGIPLLQGAGPIDGHPDLITSYRTELGGITAVLCLLQLIARSTGLTQGMATVYCDNKAALEAIFTEHPRRGIYPLLAPDYDFISIARKIVSTMPIKIQEKWVKGHYKGDDRQVAHDLNDLVDTMATEFRRNPPRGYSPKAQSLVHSLQTAAVMSGGAIVTSKLKSIIYRNMFSSGLEATICKNTGWEASYMQTIDWEAHEIVVRSFSRFKRISIAKCIHGLWHTGAQKVLYGMDDAGLCPCCNQELETTTHVYQCPAPAVVDNRRKLLQVMEQQFSKRRIPVAVHKCIFQGLKWFLLTPTEVPPTPIPNSLGQVYSDEVIARNAYHAQTKLGWEQGLRGRLSKAWEKAICHNLNGEKREEKATMMVRWVMKRLLQLSLDLWIYRNGILHGVTREEQQRRACELLQQQVREAFDYYHTKPTIVSSCDRYLFERKSLEQRLLGDKDALQGWLNTVEVALASQEARQAAAAEQAERFFLPFYQAGQLKQTKPRQDSPPPPVPTGPTSPPSSLPDTDLTQDYSPASKVAAQLDAEAPSFLRDALLRPAPAQIDLTALFADVEDPNYTSASPSPLTTSDNNSLDGSTAELLHPGPFCLAIVDNQYSSDSSYTPEPARDLPLQLPSDTTSSHSTISIGEYLAYCQREASDTDSIATSTGQSDTSTYSPVTEEDYTNDTPLSPPLHPDASERFTQQSHTATTYSLQAPGSHSPSISTTIEATPRAPLPKEPVSEVLGMLQFLRSRETVHPSDLAVTGTVPLPLSADTFGWLQQDDEVKSEDNSRSPSLRTRIPFSEQDDPPDNLSDRLP